MTDHRYPGGDDHTSDCAYGCGAWAGPFNSGAPDGIDPFGDCPNAPLTDPSAPTVTITEAELSFALADLYAFRGLIVVAEGRAGDITNEELGGLLFAELQKEQQ